MAVNKRKWKLAFLLAGILITLTALYIICWGIQLVFFVKKLNTNPNVFTGFTPLIWHIEELGHKIEKAGTIYWMALGGAIVQIINGVWRWISND